MLKEDKTAMGVVGVVLIAAALIGLLRLLSGCAGVSDALERGSRLAKLAIVGAAIACDEVADQCIKDKLHATDCKPLQTCHKVQRIVTREARTAVLVADTALEVKDANLQKNALLKVIALLGRVRTALEPYGVKIPGVGP